MASQHKLLIANRGEIAMRILRSARDLALPTVAVYMEADASAPHALQADEAYIVPTYIDQDALLEVCRTHKVTMIHPGYGFLSENEEFAAKVESAGLIWLGPTAEQIASMGLKHEARARAIAADVPVLPGSELVATLEAAVEQATRVDYPIMLKATGGGGGMGMSICNNEAELRDVFQSTVDMTRNLFSNGGVFVEKYIPRARHIEVQVFGDGQGNVIHCGERECSVQRRQQKVLEEATSPFIDRHPEMREAMCSAAVRLCELINYRSAGTVEFLVDDERASFFFLELNSRIQVEHAVTEMVRPGLDLVGLMIRLGLSSDVLSSFSLPSQSDVAIAYGNAIEARIYAEIPHLNFKPAPGLLQEVSFPTAEWIRIDTWVETGSQISSFFDPMIAKLICWGSTRKEARSRLSQALRETVLRGTTTNLEYLRTIVDCKEFVDGDVTTKFLDSFDYLPNCIEVIDAGLSTTVQDGRPRLPTGGDGIPRSGFADSLSAQVANLLVGNPADTELFEATVGGPSLKFSQNTVVAVTGAAVELYVDEDIKSMWTRFVVPAGGTLEVGSCENTGNRVYIAVRGGFPDVPLFAGSKSTFAAAKFGGIQGREIVAGDIIPLSQSAGPLPTGDGEISLPASTLPTFPSEWTVAALPGPQADADYLLPEDRDTLYSTTYTVSSDSNRLGIRLQGLKALKYSRKDGGAGGSHPSNCVEHGYSTGALNMNGDTPVLLGVDGPDCGGLLCVLGTVEADWWKMGQLRSGDTLRFVQPTLASPAQQLEQQQEWLQAIAAAVQSGTTAGLLPFPLNVNGQSDTIGDGLVGVVPEDKATEAPQFSFKLSGDGGLMVEIGVEQNLSFRTRLIGELWERRLRAKEVEGIYAIIPGVASFLIKFHPTVLQLQTLLDLLYASSEGLAAESLEQVVPSRRLHLPVVFNDSGLKGTIERYMASTGRKKAVYLPDNLDYLAKANGLNSVDEVVSTFCKADWYVVSRSFFAGLPMMGPFDHRSIFKSQKYNPTRTFTPAGSLGLAGVMAATYPVDSPGGYQLVGKTLTPWSPWGRYGPPAEYESKFLLRNFDVIHWLPMPETEFLEIEKAFTAGSYNPLVEQYEISAKEVLEFERKIKLEVAELEQKRKEGFEALSKQEAEYVAEYQAELARAKEAEAQAAGTGGKAGSTSGTPLKSPVLGTIRSLAVKVGDELSIDVVPVKVEAMKTEIAIKLSRKLLGKKVTGIAVELGDVVKPGQPLLYCETNE
ncbi:bifunctional urea carboxylase/allophanate hydrolase [Rhodotorula paludigena]|uniref:bifunctional urea carboxylase/allophanate hydrolase n=1 Tax=Rhodotorula paludigena TaxID=86838 RepID=UPI003181F160